MIRNIHEAFSNFVKSGAKAQLKHGKYIIQGITNEGIKIEMYITQKGYIKTACPIL